MANASQPKQRRGKVSSTSRRVSTEEADKAPTRMDRIKKLNGQIQELHFSHNEQRRLIPILLNDIVAELAGDIANATAVEVDEQKAAKAADGEKEAK